MTSLHHPRGRGILPAVLALSLLGVCRTYYDHSEAAHAAVSRGDYRGGVKEMNAILGVDSGDELPSEWKAERKENSTSLSLSWSEVSPGASRPQNRSSASLGDVQEASETLRTAAKSQKRNGARSPPPCLVQHTSTQMSPLDGKYDAAESSNQRKLSGIANTLSERNLASSFLVLSWQ